MRRFSETKYYTAYSEAEALKMKAEKLRKALWIEFDGGGKHTIDESVFKHRKRIRTSSNARGLIQWYRGQYVHHYYSTMRKMGQITRIVFAAKEPRTRESDNAK